MTPAYSLILRAYERLLLLYPEDLRREFGADMMEAFAEDLCAARGAAGTLRVWRSALREFIQIAVPAWFEIPAVAVPLLSAALVAASQFPLIFRVVHQYPAVPSMLTDAMVAIGIEAAGSAFISFVAIYRWTRAGLITLRIA